MQQIKMEDLRGKMWAGENECGSSALRYSNLTLQNILYDFTVLFHE